MSRVSPAPRTTSRAQVRGAAGHAFEELTFQEQRGPGAVVGDRQLAGLGPGEFGHGDVGMGAGADAQAVRGLPSRRKDGQRAERAAGADVKLLDLHGNLLMIYRISAPTELGYAPLASFAQPCDK